MIPLVLLTVREDLAPVWDKVASEIRTRYYARSARKAEMERRLDQYAPLAKAAPNRQAFEAAVNAMIAEFGDSHFELFSDEDQGYYLMDGLTRGEKAATMPQIGAWFRRAPDGYTVQMVLDGGAAERAGLQVGDLVTRVDGQPFSPVVGLKDDVGRSAALTYRRGTEETQTKVEVTRTTALRMFLDATLASRRTVEREGKKFAVLHLWTQASTEFEKALTDALASAKDADGFVLDLRSGFGGHVGGFESAIGKGGYAGPLAIVVDRGSRSAKELLSFDAQRAGRATIVGERTAGAVLGASPDRLNAWAYLEVPVVDYVVKGVRLEKRGVEPDVPVPPGADPVERAVEVLAARKV